MADSGTKVYVGGLAWATDEHSLRTAFEAYGRVVESRVLVDAETGRSRGYGFITFAEPADAERALVEANGSEVDGRSVRVGWATRDKPHYGGDRFGSGPPRRDYNDDRGGGSGAYRGGGGGGGGERHYSSRDDMRRDDRDLRERSPRSSRRDRSPQRSPERYHRDRSSPPPHPSSALPPVAAMSSLSRDYRRDDNRAAASYVDPKDDYGRSSSGYAAQDAAGRAPVEYRRESTTYSNGGTYTTSARYDDPGTAGAAYGRSAYDEGRSAYAPPADYGRSAPIPSTAPVSNWQSVPAASSYNTYPERDSRDYAAHPSYRPVEYTAGPSSRSYEARDYAADPGGRTSSAYHDANPVVHSSSRDPYSSPSYREDRFAPAPAPAPVPAPPGPSSSSGGRGDYSRDADRSAPRQSRTYDSYSGRGQSYRGSHTNGRDRPAEGSSW